MRTTAQRSVPDPTIYPEEERVGESLLQRWITEVLRPLLEWWLNVHRKRTALVGADQFIYWRQHDAHARVAPDVYVLPGVDPRTEVRVWKLWEHPVVPSFALEVVSEDWKKDYFEAPLRYDDCGVPELVIFDPAYEAHPDGVRWQVYRRIGKHGLVRVEASNGDRVRSRSLRCWLRSVGEGLDLRVRVAEGRAGQTLVPTAEERAEAERAAREAERVQKEAECAQKEAECAQKEIERAQKEAERAQKEAALARVAKLEEELDRLKTRRKKS